MIYPPPKDSNRLVPAAGSGDPIQVRHEATLGQREICRFYSTTLKQKKVCHSSIWQIGRLADHPDVFAAIKSPRARHRRSLVLCPSVKTDPGMTIRVENRLRLSQSLLDSSCVDGFAAGHSTVYCTTAVTAPMTSAVLFVILAFFIYILNSFDDTTCLNDRQSLVLTHIPGRHTNAGS